MKKYSPYFLVFIGLVIIFLGTTGSLTFIIDSVLVRIGLKSELEVSTMGFIPFAVPVESRLEHDTAPAVQITRSAAGALSSFFPTPTTSSLIPFANVTEVAPTPTATPKPTPIPTIPIRLEIPAINLEAPITAANPSEINIGGDVFEQWEAPNEFAVGWHTTSALVGSPGNTVLNGHHNISGKVFENLHKVVAGDEIIVYGGNLRYSYLVVNVMILPERNVDMATRMENARWILPSTDERLTLITCWPAESNTHRLIVVAQPFRETMELTPTTAPISMK